MSQNLRKIMGVGVFGSLFNLLQCSSGHFWSDIKKISQFFLAKQGQLKYLSPNLQSSHQNIGMEWEYSGVQI